MGSTLFYTAHWRTYTTGTLLVVHRPTALSVSGVYCCYNCDTLSHLQFGWIDVTEGQFVMMVVMLVTAAEGFFGVNIWNSPVFIIIIIIVTMTMTTMMTMK